MPIRKMRFKITAVRAPVERDELKIGLIHGCTPVKASGMRSTVKPNMREMPMINVFRASIILDMTICNPAMTMKLRAKIRVAPITGFGIMANTAESFGKKLIPISMPPME